MPFLLALRSSLLSIHFQIYARLKSWILKLIVSINGRFKNQTLVDEITPLDTRINSFDATQKLLMMPAKDPVYGIDRLVKFLILPKPEEIFG